MTERIFALRENWMKYVDAQEIPVRDRAYRAMVELYKNDSVKIQFAYGFAQTLKEKSILIQKEDVLAGYLYQYAYNVNFPLSVSEDFDPATRASFRMDVRRELLEFMEVFDISNDSDEAEELRQFAEGVESWLYKHWHSGHILAGYPQLLQKGFGGILSEVLEEKKKCQNEREEKTLESFEIVTKACMDYILRYKLLAEEMAEKAESLEEKEHFQTMRSNLEWIAVRPPESFLQAIQLVWLANEMMYCENIPSAISIGRLDYYLYPYYKKDIESGRITEMEAQELIDAFFIKCGSQRKAYQNLTIGGCDSQGKSSVNELTYFCLRASKKLKFDQPSLVYRWSDDQPELAWQEVLGLIREGMGFPAIMNDSCCMKARAKTGILKEECYNYSLLGCVEFGMQGEEYALTELLRLNLPKILNLMLHGGRDIETEKVFSLGNRRNLDEIASYEEFYRWYIEEVLHFSKLGIRCIQRFEKLYSERYPLPYLSILTDNCIRVHKDVAEGGAKYNSVGFNLCGMATVADSLMAIKKIVFEENRLLLSEYAEILEKDFKGAEHIQRYAKYRCMKYGNAHSEVDNTVADIISNVRNLIDTYETIWGGRYRLGLYSVEDHAIMGMYTGATPDGRNRGVSLSNSMSAVQGMDKEGPTSLLNSATIFDLSKADNGMVLDIKFLPAFLEDITGQNALRKLIETYFNQGGMEIQISVVSKETLLAAQKEPEKYSNLIVRVSGFSAYFVTLRKATQDEIIERTECG